MVRKSLSFVLCLCWAVLTLSMCQDTTVASSVTWQLFNNTEFLYVLEKDTPPAKSIAWCLNNLMLFIPKLFIKSINCDINLCFIHKSFPVDQEHPVTLWNTYVKTHMSILPTKSEKV